MPVPAAMPEAPEGALATCLPLLKRRWFAVSIGGCLARRTLLVGWFLGRLLLAHDVLRPGVALYAELLVACAHYVVLRCIRAVVRHALAHLESRWCEACAPAPLGIR